MHRNNGAVILDQAQHFLSRFVSAPSHALALAVLWAAHTHARTASGSLATDTSPRLMLLSKGPGSGKSVLLGLVGQLSADAQVMIDATPAGFATTISEGQGTVLLDETDVLFGAGNAKSVLRSLLNAGYRDGAVWRRSNKDTIPLFAPVAMAGLSTRWYASADLAPLRSRCLEIELTPAPAGTELETFRHRVNGPMAAALALQVSRWVTANLATITETFPPAPEGIHNRQEELCEPILQIADAAGGHWPETAREALVAILRAEPTEEQREDDVPITHRLIDDLTDVFTEAGNPAALSTVDVVEGLQTLPFSPWDALWPNPATAPRELSELLSPLGVAPVRIRKGNQVLRGYRRAEVAALAAELTAERSGVAAVAAVADVAEETAEAV